MYRRRCHRQRQRRRWHRRCRCRQRKMRSRRQSANHRSQRRRNGSRPVRRIRSRRPAGMQQRGCPTRPAGRRWHTTGPVGAGRKRRGASSHSVYDLSSCSTGGLRSQPAVPRFRRPSSSRRPLHCQSTSRRTLPPFGAAPSSWRACCAAQRTLTGRRRWLCLPTRSTLMHSGACTKGRPRHRFVQLLRPPPVPSLRPPHRVPCQLRSLPLLCLKPHPPLPLPCCLLSLLLQSLLPPNWVAPLVRPPALLPPASLQMCRSPLLQHLSPRRSRQQQLRHCTWPTQQLLPTARPRHHRGCGRSDQGGHGLQ